MWRALTTIALAIAAVFNVSCLSLIGGNHAFLSEPIDGLRGSAKRSTSVTSSESAARNVVALTDYRNFETSFYHTPRDPDSRPQHCLALSGGGVRAATYSIGILHGLAKRDLLGSLDVISGVSGGAYALSWYYLQQWKEDVADEKPRGFPIKGIDQIMNNTDAWNPVFLRTFNPTDVFRKVLGGSLMAIGETLSWIAVGQSYWSIRTYHHTLYADTLAKIYHNSSLQEKNPTLYEMADFIRERKLPLFVINATVQRFGWYRNEKASLWAGVFEMTPRWIGSPALGHRLLPYDEVGKFGTVKDAVAVSAAAIDAESVIGVGPFVDFMGYSLGRGIEWNHTIDGRIVRFWGEDNDALRIFRIHLTDGGHIENLGAYALVRRLCKNITIVDAEYDPSYDFGSYVNLKRRLLEEMNVNFEVPEIDKILEFPNADTSFTSRKRLDKFDSSKPVMKGTIGPFAWAGRNDANPHYIWLDVTYIKMSIDEHILCKKPGYDDQRAVEHYGESLVRFYQGNRSWIQKDSDVACQSPFPQYSTVNQFYNADRMKAYMDLGYHTIDHYFPR